MLLSLGIFAAIAVVVVLLSKVSARTTENGMQRLNDARRSSCRFVGRGELVDGKQHIPVAMALSSSTLYYENADLTASLDLVYVEEVEYADELITGQSVNRGKVMRLRCFSKVFEFVIDQASTPRWQAVLPAVRAAG